MKTKNLVLYGLLIALTCIGTMIIQIPMLATNGYVNVGDSVIIVSALAFGPVGGFLAGGIGSMLADLFSGYAHYALATLIVKGLEGAIVGWIFYRFGQGKLMGLVAGTAGVLWMIVGYFLVATVMYGSAFVALESVPGNSIQALASIGIGLSLFTALIKTGRLSGILEQ